MKRQFIRLLFLGFLLAVFLLPVRGVLALPIPIENWSFEDDVLADGAWTDYIVNPIDGWGSSAPSSTGTLNPTVGPGDGPMFSDSVPHEYNVAWLNDGRIGQWLDATLMEGYRYTLTVYVGLRKDLVDVELLPTYGLRLIEATTADLSAWQTLAEISGPTPPEGTFALASLTFDALSAGTGLPLGINLISSGPQVNFDAVRLDASPIAAVPEPTTVLLLGTGLLGLAWLGRKKFLRKS